MDLEFYPVPHRTVATTPVVAEEPSAEEKLYFETQDRYRPMVAKDFYTEHADLADLDNGGGAFVLANNKNVTLSELTAYGTTQLSATNPTKARLEAARDLASRLEQKPRPFAQYYINEVLDDDVAALVLLAGAQKLFAGFEDGIGGVYRPLPPIDYSGTSGNNIYYTGPTRFR